MYTNIKRQFGFIALLIISGCTIILAVSCQGPQRTVVIPDPEPMVRTDERQLPPVEPDTSYVVFPEIQKGEKFYYGPYYVGSYFGFDKTYPGYNYMKDMAAVPDIPGLIFRSKYGIHIGLRCPSDSVLLNWSAYRLKEFANRYIAISGEYPSCDSPKSAADIINHYFNPNLAPRTAPDRNDPEELYVQNAVLLYDVCSSEQYSTFREIYWNKERLSAGNHTGESWYTVDRKSGKVLSIRDIVRSKDHHKLAHLVFSHLLNGSSDPWSLYHSVRESEITGSLLSMSGCALVEEGLLVYYHPYVIGSGAEGQYNALVPYSEIDDILTVSFHGSKSQQ